MLQQMMVQQMYKDWIEDVPWIEKMSGPCLVQMVLKMKNMLYIPGEVLSDVRMTTFVQTGILFLGGRTLHKGDSWGIDMTLEGYMRRRESGFAMNFVSTLAITYSHLQDVLSEFPDDAWMVKRVSSWMALKRYAFKIAQDARAKAQKAPKQSTIAKVMSMTKESGKDAEFVNLTDDTRYTIKTITSGFIEQKDTLQSLGKAQAAMQSSQDQARRRAEAVEAALAGNTEALRSMDQRLASLEQNVQQILSMLQERALPATPTSNSKNRIMSFRS
jgi:hypothetical protein